METWALLKSICSRMTIPWLCVGDYNEILYDEKKRGGSLRPERQVAAFRKMTETCGFLDLPIRGPLHTWFHGSGDDCMKIRLDRAMATLAWLDRFDNSLEEHLINARSDHLPILIHLSSIQVGYGKKSSK